VHNFDDIKTLAASVLDEMGLELVECQLSGANKSAQLRIFVYEKGGVSIDRCAEASHRIGDLLDRKDLINGRYRLEVSSPGLDRPLKTIRDYERNIGEKVTILVPVDGKEQKLVGIIARIEQNLITLTTEDETEISVDVQQIKSAKIVIEF